MYVISFEYLCGPKAYIISQENWGHPWVLGESDWPCPSDSVWMVPGTVDPEQ